MHTRGIAVKAFVHKQRLTSLLLPDVQHHSGRIVKGSVLWARAPQSQPRKQQELPHCARDLLSELLLPRSGHGQRVSDQLCMQVQA